MRMGSFRGEAEKFGSRGRMPRSCPKNLTLVVAAFELQEIRAFLMEADLLDYA